MRTDAKSVLNLFYFIMSQIVKYKKVVKHNHNSYTIEQKKMLLPVLRHTKK